MHPPRFLSNHHLLDWPDCFLELHCCKGKTVYPVRMLAERSGNLTFAELLARLRCEKCRSKMRGPVYLCAGHQREFQGGSAPDWSLELVPPPRNCCRLCGNANGQEAIKKWRAIFGTSRPSHAR
jgi:hypothetical protein